jgi:hypothetical protein
MSSTTEIILGVGAMHLIAFTAACSLILLMWRSDSSTDFDNPGEEDGGGGGGGSKTIRPRPSLGGPPLADATPANIRLRGPGRLGRGGRTYSRRPAHHPAPARRTRPRR